MARIVYSGTCPKPTSANSASISLSNGQTAFVSKKDYSRISSVPWYASGGYAVHRHQKMHREVADAPSGTIVDHINGNPLDNRRCNLRVVDASQSSANRGRSQTKLEGGFKGVYRVGDRWRVKIKKDGQQHHVGYFSSEKAAAEAYDAAASERFGKYARLNFGESQRRNAMSHKVVVQEGYSLPFEGFSGAKRKHKVRMTKKRKAALRKAAATMRACGKKWKHKSVKFRKTHKWTAFVKKCAKSRR